MVFRKRRRVTLHDLNSYTAFKNYIIRSQNFRKFMETREFSTFVTLLSYVIRGPRNTGRYNLYEDYYLKGKIPSRWSQNDLAKMHNISQSGISKRIKKLEKKWKVLKIDSIILGQYTHNIYILGNVDNPIHININKRNEKLFYDSIFSRLALPHNINKNRPHASEECGPHAPQAYIQY